MHMVIKSFTSGIRQRCRSLPPTLMLLGVFVLLAQSATSDDFNGTITWNLTAVDRLRLQLFTNYDKSSYPTHLGVPTNISLSLSVNYVDIDEANNKMTLHSWLSIRWLDDNRSWDEKEYDNVTRIHMKPKEVWRPDITLFNSAGDNGNYLGDTQILLEHTGSFLWVPPAIYTAYCNLNLRLWPYDTQVCKVKIGSWTLTYIDPHFEVEDVVNFDDYVQSTEWEIVDTKAKYYLKDYYNYVEYTFQLRRRSSMYSAVIFTPASCVIWLALLTFWLPPQMGEKILLNGIVIVVITAFLMYFAQLLPILADNTPLVVIFYSTSLLLLSISTIIAVFVLYLSTAKHKRRVPDMLRNLLNGSLGSVLLLTHFSLEAEPQSLLNNGTKELGEHVYDNPDNETTDPLNINPTASPSNRSIQFDWVLLATAVDRICFLFYSLIFIVLAIVYSV